MELNHWKAGVCIFKNNRRFIRNWILERPYPSKAQGSKRLVCQRQGEKHYFQVTRPCCIWRCHLGSGQSPENRCQTIRAGQQGLTWKEKLKRGLFHSKRWTLEMLDGRQIAIFRSLMFFWFKPILVSNCCSLMILKFKSISSRMKNSFKVVSDQIVGKKDHTVSTKKLLISFLAFKMI